MSSLSNLIHLVDIHGFDVAVGEKNLPEVDPNDVECDPEQWPAWTDEVWELGFDPDQTPEVTEADWADYDESRAEIEMPYGYE